MNWNIQELKLMPLVIIAAMITVYPVTMDAKEVMPNSTVTTYQHGGEAWFEEIYTPPNNYEFKKIHPNANFEYFNWRPQELCEVVTAGEGPNQINAFFSNPPGSADLFIGTIDGELIGDRLGSGGGGGVDIITWEGKIKGINFDITKVPLKYLAQAESHIPIVLKVTLPNDDNRELSTSDVRLEGVYMQVGDLVAIFPLNEYVQLEAGDLYTRPVNHDVENTFTIIVNQELVDNAAIIVTPDHMTENAYWHVDLSVKSKDGEWLRCGEYIRDGFITGYAAGSCKEFIYGDNTIPTYELTMGRITGDNGRYDVTEQENFRKGYEQYFIAKDSDGNIYNNEYRYEWEYNPKYGCYSEWGLPTDTRSLIIIKYKTGGGGIDGDPMAFTVADERRGGNVVFFEGRSQVSLKSGGSINNVYDPTLISDEISFEYFTDNNGDSYSNCLKMIWGEGWEFDSPFHDLVGLMESSSLIGGSIMVAASIISPNPYIWNLGAIFADTAIASQIFSSAEEDMYGVEYGGYLLGGAWVIQREEGHVPTEDWNIWCTQEESVTVIPGDDPPVPSCECKYPIWRPYIDPATHVNVEAGDHLSGYVSATLRAGSPSGTDWGFSYELDMWLDFNIGQDKYIDIYPISE